MEQHTKQVTVEYVDAKLLFAQFEEIKALVAEINKQLNPPKVDKYLTREEVASLLKISLPTLHDWTKKGFLQSYRIGNALRYKEEEVLSSPIAIKKI